MTLAVVFPGQGSQSVGMLADLGEQIAVKACFEEASEVMALDLWELVQNGPNEKLNSTEITQPAMLTAGVACWRMWKEQGGADAAMMAGHSLGEYSALVCAGSLQFADAVALVQERGRLMQSAVPSGEGAMAALLGLDDETVVKVCTEAAQGDVVEAVNFNAPGQVVIAGSKNAVERAVGLAKDKGAKRAIVLPVSVPSHCSLMKPAAEKLADKLQSVAISAPSIPVLNNVDVMDRSGENEIRDALVRQLFNPVRWVETIREFHNRGVDNLLECGPGKVLTGLNKRIEKQMSATPVFDLASLKQALGS